MLDEPVRGSLPDPTLFSLSGLEQVRAYVRRQSPRSPLARLLGARLTQVSSGAVVLSVPISPWFEMQGGLIDLMAVAEAAVFMAALSGAPPATAVRTANLSLRYLRPCTLDNEAINARARILHAGSSFTTVEAQLEDVIGRAVCHATASVLMRPMEPPPPRPLSPMAEIEEPGYSTPDPPRRPAPLQRATPSEFGHLIEFLGINVEEMSAGGTRASMPASEWFCGMYREVQAGIIGVLAEVAAGGANLALVDEDERLAALSINVSCLAPVAADGRRLTAVGSVDHRLGDVAIGASRVFTESGLCVAVGSAPMLLVKRGRKVMQRSEPVLLTVLFTDLVGSTERVGQLGDARWQELLAEHDALVRRQLEVFNGREVKTTGDGFLVVFDSASRAVRCAAAVRAGLDRLGLEMRAGLHTGECVMQGGDIAGLAVHVASRVETAARPGEILVSSTVRDVLAGSGVRLADRGMRTLKGLDGDWHLYAVEQAS